MLLFLGCFWGCFGAVFGAVLAAEKGKRGRGFLGLWMKREREREREVLSNEITLFIPPLFIASFSPHICAKCPSLAHHSTLYHAL